MRDIEQRIIETIGIEGLRALHEAGLAVVDEREFERLLSEANKPYSPAPLVEHQEETPCPTQ